MAAFKLPRGHDRCEFLPHSTSVSNFNPPH
jgi:hypothetical protein